MGSLGKPLMLVLVLALALLPLLVLPRTARESMDSALTAMMYPPRTLADWLQTCRWSNAVSSEASDAALEAESLRFCFEARRGALLHQGEAAGAGDGLRDPARAAVELATRDRYFPMRVLIRSAVMARTGALFTDSIRLACGRRKGVYPGSVVLNEKGYMMGRVTQVWALSCTMVPLGSPRLRVFCDILDGDGLQGMLVGPWQEDGASSHGPDGTVEVQMSARGAAPALHSHVATSLSAQTEAQEYLPGALAIGRVVDVETTEEGYTRARVKLWGGDLPELVYVGTGERAARPGEADQRDALASRARYRCELRRLLPFQHLYIPRARREVERARTCPDTSPDVASIAIAAKVRRLSSFHEEVLPVAPDCFGLRPGIPCVQGDALLGVMMDDGTGALCLRLLTSMRLPISVMVIQSDGTRYPGILAIAEGASAVSDTPEGWCIPGQPRLQLVSLSNDGLAVLLPAEIVTAEGGPLDIPAGIPVGRLIGDRDDEYGPAWSVISYADFSMIDYGSCKIRSAALAEHAPPVGPDWPGDMERKDGDTSHGRANAGGR